MRLRTRTALQVTPFLLLGACFSPSMDDDDANDGAATEGDHETGTGSDGSASSTASNGSSPTSTSDTTHGGDGTDADDYGDETRGDSDPDTGTPVCGDGIVDDGEECDNGRANGERNECTEECLLNVCGDGILGPDEGCDDGAANAAEVGQCAPDCSHVVQSKQILRSADDTNPNLGGSPIAAVDAMCPAGYKALFGHGNARRATTMPNAVVDPIDWVVQPYTQYVNEAGEVVWFTDDVPLLGMRNGAFEGLENSIAGSGSAITGLAQDWTNNVSNNCNGWQVGTDAVGKNVGIASQTTIGFINNGGVQPCSYSNYVYCVEQ